jgi:phosphoribosyl-dephospho-CoA transferase
MRWFLPRFDSALPRHCLLRVAPCAWDAVLAVRPDLAGDPLLQDWAALQRPLISRRRLPDEGPGIALGLPLPPSAGKRRIAVLMQVHDIVSVVSLPGLSACIATAPPAWHACLRQLSELAREYELQAGVFGSLAWQSLTGLTYLGPESDIDIAWEMPRADRLERFMAELVSIEEEAPMRLDGEVIRRDGAAVNWRELHGGALELAVKTASALVLCTRDDFVGMQV